MVSQEKLDIMFGNARIDEVGVEQLLHLDHRVTLQALLVVVLAL